MRVEELFYKNLFSFQGLWSTSVRKGNLGLRSADLNQSDDRVLISSEIIDK